MRAVTSPALLHVTRLQTAVIPLHGCVTTTFAEQLHPEALTPVAAIKSHRAVCVEAGILVVVAVVVAIVGAIVGAVVVVVVAVVPQSGRDVAE